jgi:hypothetical protein
MPEPIEPKGQDPAPVSAPASPEPTQPVIELGKDGKPFNAERAQALIDKLDAEAKEGKKAAKRLAELEAKEKAREEAELSELEKARKESAELRAMVTAAERRELQRSVAEKVGLPAILANRIQGDDEASMTEDATALLAAIPAKVAPKINPTNPGEPQTGETDAERRERLGFPTRKSK